MNSVRTGTRGPRAAVPAARTSVEAAPQPDDSVHLGRQPMFDADMQIIGYELLFRSANRTTADISDPEKATADVVVRTFADFGLDAVVGKKLAFVNLPRGFLTGAVPLPFAPQGVVLEVLEDVVADTEVLAGVHRLRDQGFRFALDDFVWSEATEPLIALCDCIKIDVLTYSAEELTALVNRLRPFDVQLLAEKVETPEQFELCRSLSFAYYQGYLLSKPTVLTRRSLDSTRLACLRLLAVLGSADYDVSEAEAAIRSDPGLTLRILRMINSAGTGLRRRVSSVREAVLLLGPRSLIGWVMLMSMSGSGTGAGADHVDVALTRARMCELLAAAALVPADAAFTVGLVSSLDLLLGMPVEEAIADLPLEADVADAVLHRSGALGSVLSAVLAYEALDGEALVPLGRARDAYLSAMAWTRSVLAGAAD